MDARELTAEERLVLFGLVGHLAGADGIIAEGEEQEMAALGEEIGCDPKAEIASANARYPSLDELMGAAAGLQRPGARQLMRTLLLDLAGADGERGAQENELLGRISDLWMKG